MNRMKRLISLMLFVCGMAAGVWAQSTSDVLSGGFTINANGEMIQFSKGNLQYVDGSWQFAEHQYEYFGTNQSASHCDIFANNSYSFPDDGLYWRILSQSEWNYLLSTRSVNNTLSSGARYSMATIGDAYKGVIVFPDNYTHPEDADFSGNCNNASENYTSTVSLDGWAKMEAAGCVFLPAAGWGYSYTDIRNVDVACFYNSSTSRDGNSRYTPGFNNGINLSNWSNNTTWIPVRPVKLKTELQQDTDGYCLLGTVQDWKDFATLVETTPTANARMTADIDLGNDQTKIASGDNIYYKGTFDGQGHSLTVAYVETDGSSQHCAPFIRIQGATIQNLHIKGSITTAGMRPASITSYVRGTSYVKNCWSEVDITSSYNADICAGGIVTRIDTDQTLNMSNCLFTGSITLSNSAGYRAGGLIGWTQSNGTANVQNCLFAPSGVTSTKSSSDNKMLVSGYQSKVTITNCYYRHVGSTNNWEAQGKKAESSQLAEGSLAYKLQAFRDQLNWGQKLGTDAVPVPFTVDESRRVYRANSGGFTNAPAEGYVFHQDTDGYYIVGSLDGWQDFAIQVEFTSDAKAKMTADINLGDDQTVIATTYSGTFDGQGHTLTVNLTATQSRYGLFYTLAGATIKNLHVAGTVSTSYNYTGVIAGLSGTYYRETITLDNCWSSVTINASSSADHTGGLVGLHDNNATLIMNDCLFDGSFDGAQSEEWGGFLGLNYYATVKITNSLFAPTSINIKGDLSTFSYNWGGSTQTNCFTSVLGNTTQGVLVSEEQISNGNVAYLLQKGRNDLIWSQTIGSDTHPLLFGDNSSRVYSTANGGYTNNQTQADPDLVLDFTIADNGDISINGFRSDFIPPADYALVIPDYIGGYPVIAIARGAFKQKSTIKSLSIGRNVQSIGYQVFMECTGLQSVEIPNNVTSLDDAVFSGCTSLSSATFEDGCQLPEIPYDAFYNCTSLTEITIPSSVTFIDSYAFQNCSMTSLTIPANVTSLGDCICKGNSNLATFDLSKATQVAALYGMTTVNRSSGILGIFAGIPATCDVILPYGCQATGNHVIIAEPDENSIGIADDGYYELSNAEHWKAFCTIAQGKPTAKARLTADINLGDDQTTLGPTEASAYKGTFDGQGHTLTVNLSSTADIWAPFCYVGDGAVIQNLHIAGTVNGAHRRIGGFVGEGKGTYSISNCISSVKINTTYNGDGIQGGFVASQRGTLQISDCIFDGVFYGPNAYTWGGIVGWKYSTTSISNCLVLCDSYNVKKTDVATFIPNDNNITNCFYKTAIYTAQGTQASEVELADGTTAYKLQNNRADLVWGQRIGIDAEPVLTSDESYRVYRTNTGGYTNDPSQAYEGLKQDAEDNYYLISSIADWQEYATLIETSPTANAKMTADINLGSDQTKIGSESTPYQGTFDGQGHSLTMAYVETDGSSQHAAPFIKIKDATIQNLHVKGYITTAGMRPAGITSYVTGTCYIKNCWSEVDISSSRSADICAGGLVTRIDADQTLNMSDCLFTGSITLSHSNGYRAGGLIGWTQDKGIANVENCLVAPSGISTKKNTTDNKMLVSGYQSKVTITNCYYNISSTCNWAIQGTFATDEDLDYGTTTDLLQAGRDEQIWMQDAVSDLPQLAVFGSSSPSVKVPYAIWCEDNKTLYFDSADTRLRVGKTYDGHTITSVWSGNNVVETPQEAVPAWNDIVKGTCTHVVFKESFSEMRPTSLYYWFFEFLLLEDITGLEYLNTSEATTMRGMFLFCDALTEIDVSNFDTSKSTTFRSMFDHCVSLKALDVSSFKMKQGDNTQNMFYNCQKLEVIYSRNEWYSKIGSGNNTYTMFFDCYKLKGETGYEYNPNRIYDGTYATFDYFFTRKPIYAGDVNGDGIVTITDAMLVVDSLTTGQPLEGTARQAADTNGDGEITYTDVVNILDMILAP